MKKGVLRPSAAIIGMLILIFDSRAALSGAREGIELCIRTLIPSLFPFFILSSYLTGNFIGRPVKILRPICNLCGVPAGAESLLSVGFLGGYPVGAQNVAQAFCAGGVSKADAERLLAFCNNAGPAFIFGILGQMFSERYVPWMLWGIHMVSALMVGVILSNDSNASVFLPGRTISFTKAQESSLKVMALVCGWVIVFRIVLTFLQRWFLWMLPEGVQIIISGFLELSNGCVQLSEIAPEGLRFLLAGVLLSVGGLCVAMQTASVAGGLSLRQYFIGKGMQSLISLILCGILQFIFPPEQRVPVSGIWIISGLMLPGIFSIPLLKKKKRSSIPGSVGV